MPRTINTAIESVPLAALKPHHRNVNQGDFGAIAESIESNGFFGTLVANRRTGRILVGNHRYHVAKAQGFAEVPVAWVDVSDEEELRILLADNRTARLGSDNEAALAELLSELIATDVGLIGTGFDGDDLDRLIADLADAAPGAGDGDGEDKKAVARQTLAERFIVPPFSVLDARQGYWQDRKRTWLSLGIKSELGRGEATLGSDGKTRRGDGKGKNFARTVGQDLMRGEHIVGDNEAAPPPPPPGVALNDLGGGGGGAYLHKGADGFQHKRTGNGLLGESEQARSGYAAQRLTWVAGDRDEDDIDDVSRKNLMAQPQSGTSIFDPVLCEIAYRWFCTPGGAVLDPFAGGSVRGIVAALLGYHYTGIELRPEQVVANQSQAPALLEGAASAVPPCWITGDSSNVATLAPGAYDLVFTCPPYADLEVYSDDPADLSTMPYEAFLTAYRHIIAEAIALLKPDRFAVFVVGDLRDAKGFYRNFVSDTIAAAQDAGALLYNEAILVTMLGSLPIRTGRQFAIGRKLGKTHQNVLVFFKGDPATIKAAYPEIQIGGLEEAEEGGEG